MEAFVYTWTNLETNQLYIGSHKGTPDDGYVCSSKPMLEDYMKNRSVFSRQIVATGSFEEMTAFESTLLKAVNAKDDPQFYNQHNSDGKFNYRGGAKKGQFAGEKNPNYGNYWTDEQRKSMSANRKGKGTDPKPLEQREKMRQSALALATVQCPHCGKSGKPAPMTRWHFDKCKEA